MIGPAERIGHIRIEEHLAEGGMGAVFVGFDERLERRVALKAVRSDRPEARVRFLLEARLLSQIDHPNVCRIHGYLEHEDGDLLVLEWIRGHTLRQALAAGLDPATRLAIAEGVARALEVAHEKNIVHRDLKLDNVMVTPEGIVKVLDFGLARRIENETTPCAPEAPVGHEQPADATMRAGHPASWWVPSQGATEAGALVGTLANMSPEQARGEPASAASDAYALGLLLQELFTGRAPYEPGLPRALLLVKAAEGDTLPVEGVPDPDLAALIRRLKALAPAARPRAADVAERLAWIRDKPRRRRRRLVGTALAGLFVAGGVKYTLDLQQERQLALAARNQARQEALRADAAARFLEDLFKSADPRHAHGRAPDARELLRRGTQRLGKELGDQPALRARLLDTLGGIHTELGLYDEARALLAEALSIRERLDGPEAPEVAQTLVRLGNVARLSGRADAVPLLRRALDIFERRRGPDSSDVADLLNSLGTALAAEGAFDEAETTLRRALVLQERLWNARDARVAKVLHNLAGIAYYRGRTDEAEQLLRRALDIRTASLPEDDLDLAGSREALALLLRDQGRAAEAARLLERLAATHEAVYGPQHPKLALTLFNLGLAYSSLGQDEAARRLFERSLAIGQNALGPRDPQLVLILDALAGQHRRHGRMAAARPLYRRILDATRQVGAGTGNQDVLAARAAALLALERVAEACPLVHALAAGDRDDAEMRALCRRHGL